MTHRTYCALRLGDNLAGLQLVRKLAQAHPGDEFIHACNLGYMAQELNLADMIEDLPNIRLCSLTDKHPDSVDLWKGQNGYFYQHPKWREYIPFMLDFYALCSARIGLPCPIKTREDMLFDYPAIQKDVGLGRFDWLVINSVPMSNQFPGYIASDMEACVEALCSKHRVVTTAPTEKYHGQMDGSTLTLAQIGNLSLSCDNILMVSTGPSWPTFNIWNDDTIKTRIILLDQERVELGKNTYHRRSWAEAHKFLLENGAL